MRLDALEHHKVIALSGTIDARRPQDNIGQQFLIPRSQFLIQSAEPLFGLQLALSISRIGLSSVILLDFRIGLLLADGSHDAQRTDIDKALQWHLQLHDGAHQVHRPFRIDATEVFFVQALRHTRCMDDIVEGMSLQLFLQRFLR